LETPNEIRRAILGTRVFGETFEASLRCAADEQAVPKKGHQDLARFIRQSVSTSDSSSSALDADGNLRRSVVIGLGDGNGPGATAGLLSLACIKKSAGIYPVACQTFVDLDEKFRHGIEHVFDLVPLTTWSKYEIGLRWSIRQHGREPLRMLDGQSMEAAFALLGAALHGAASDIGTVELRGSGAAAAEIDLRHVAVTAKVAPDGRLEPVNEVTISEKRRTAQQEKSLLFIVAENQGGLINDLKDLPTKRVASTLAAYQLVARLQSEHVVVWLSSWRARTLVLLAGSPSYVCATTIATIAVWVWTDGSTFLLTPAIAIVLWLVGWSLMIRNVAPEEQLPLERQASRTARCWLIMSDTVRCRVEKRRDFWSRWAVHELKWVVRGLRTIEKADADSPARRFRLEAFDWSLLRIPQSGLRPRRVRFLSGAAMTAVLVLFLLIMTSPVGSAIVEAVPVPEAPRITGASVHRRSPDSAAIELTRVTDEAAFVGVVGESGLLTVRATDRPRAHRRLRFVCDNCSLQPTGGAAASFSVEVPLIHGEAAVQYVIAPGEQATLEVELMTSQWRFLARARLELRDQ
jgi:hypothetical protein